jgi:hypothetical protein
MDALIVSDRYQHFSRVVKLGRLGRTDDSLVQSVAFGWNVKKG